MKDRIETEGIEVVYCPTEDMLADFFTKPLQGSLFEKFRSVIMGEAHISTLRGPSLVPVKERVEDQVIEGQDKTKVRVVVPGTHVQAPDATDITGREATYASVLKQPGRTCAHGGVKWKSRNSPMQ
jgi:hypothetical protein